MKIGICHSSLERIRMAKRVGYNFVEVNNTTIFSMSEEDFSHLLEFKKDCSEDFFYASNGLIPGELRLTGDDVDFDAIRDFAEKSFNRLSLLGVKMLVFGSSKAKNVPAGFPQDLAFSQLIKVCRILGETAKKYDMCVCIEPLRYSECNIINTAKEACLFAREVGLSNVGGHVDYFHMMQNGEDISSLVSLASDIFHTHIASPTERTLIREDDGADYTLFFTSLRNGGYDKTVSFEGSGSGDEEAITMMLKFMKNLSKG